MELEVLIVGAGPTGLTLACDLARQGVAYRIVDRAPGPAGGSRGFTLKPHSVAIVDDLGAAARLTTEAGIETRTRVHLGHDPLFDLDNPPARPTDEHPYPNALALPQWHTAAILRDRLAELGGKVEHGVTVTHVDEHGVATVEGGETIRARYVVGADGGRSAVRKAAGIAFTGHTETARAIVADAPVTGLDPADGVHLWLGDNGRMAAFRPIHGTTPGHRPIDGAGLWQVVAPPPPDGEGDIGSLRRAVADLTGRPGDGAAAHGRKARPELHIGEPSWLSLWRYNLRLAERYRSGRILLAGDAAHVHSPFGGHGMNTGIQDAHNLGWKLGLVLRGVADESLLDTYEAERRPVGEAILADSARQMSGFLTRRVSRPMLARAMKVGFKRAQRRGRADHPVYPAGDLIGPGGGHPALDGRTPTGARHFDLFRGSHFTVLGPTTLTGLNADLVRSHEVARRDYELVRPDGYVALTTTEPAEIRAFLRRL